MQAPYPMPLHNLWGRPQGDCPECGIGTMVRIEILPPCPFPSAVTMAPALPSRQGSPAADTTKPPFSDLGAPRHRPLAPSSSQPLPQPTLPMLPPPPNKPNKEPARWCGLVHRSVSSACSPNRASPAPQTRAASWRNLYRSQACSQMLLLKLSVTYSLFEAFGNWPPAS
jgi:hypothetical protein